MLFFFLFFFFFFFFKQKTAYEIRPCDWSSDVCSSDLGAAAGRAMAGAEVVYDRLPYFFSDQYDVGLEYSGLAGRDDELIVRGELGSEGFVAFWWYGGRVNAALNLNVWDVTDPLQELIRSLAVVERDALADPDTPLESLVAVS